MKNKRKFKYLFFRAFPFFWAVIIAVLSLLPESEVDKVWFEFFIPVDKIAHFVMYAVLAFATLIALRFLNYNLRIWSIIIILAVVLYGIVIEFLQELDFIGRNASVNDVIADITGVLAGILLFYFCRRMKIFSLEYEA